MKANQLAPCNAFELRRFSTGAVKKIVISALLTLMPTLAQAATYYVSTSGNDANSGQSEASPWKTVAKVSSFNFVPGDFILFKRGDAWLNDDILRPRSGTATARITYGAYGTGNKPIIRKHAPISGANVASNWVQEGNAWYMANSSDIGRLWLNGVEVMRKQALPVTAANKYYSGNGRLYIYSATNPALTFSSITSVGSLYIVHANGVNYVTLSNLDLQGGSNAVIRMIGASNWIIDSCNIGLHTTGNGIAANAASATVPSNNNIVRNSRFVTGSKGVWGWEAKYNGDGILLSYGTNNWDMYNNHFENWGHNSIGLINMNGSSYTSKNNKFHHNYCTAPDIDYGRAIGWSSSYLTDTGNEIYDNVFYNLGVMSQINGPNLKVYRNIFNKVRSVPYRLTVAQGMNFDGYSSGIPKNNVIANNVFAYTDNAGILFGYGASLATGVQGNIIRNNIIYECDRFYNYAIRVSDSPNNLDNIWQNNLAYRTGVTDVFVYKTRRGTASEFNALNGIDGSTISGNLFADPLFVNPTAGDFHLRAGSPAINAGYASSPLDPDGTRADIGVFPYTGTVSPTPSPTPTATVAPAPSPTPTATVAPAPSPTPSPTPTATVAPAPSPTPTATVAPAPSPTPSPTLTPDTTRPVVSAFAIPSTSTSLTVSVTTFTGTDNVRVTGYRITESSLPPLASSTGWSSTAPTSYTFSSTGTKTLFAWVKDAAGNVSLYKSATVTVGKRGRNRK